jgi:nucleotide-binding universal stress UspA family protein
MYHHLLIATDGSELSWKAVDQGLALAHAVNASVAAVTTTEPWPAVAASEISTVPPIGVQPHRLDGVRPNQVKCPGSNVNDGTHYDEMARARAATILGDVCRTAARLGVVCQATHMENCHPVEGIIKAANEKGCDLIIMASHGRRGLRRLMLGSVAMEVVSRSRIPVLICR